MSDILLFSAIMSRQLSFYAYKLHSSLQHQLECDGKESMIISLDELFKLSCIQEKQHLQKAITELCRCELLEITNSENGIIFYRFNKFDDTRFIL